MITYFIKSALCLALLLIFYHLVLEREKMHNFNRFFLLGSVLFSFIAPLFVIYEYIAVQESTIPVFIEATDTVTSEIIVENPVNYTQYLVGIYVLISTVLLFRFGKNLWSIFLKIRKNQHLKFDNATLVLVDDTISPHTFWNYIFINKNEYFSEQIESELFTHELTHVTQKHTFDVLIVELLRTVFWINPTFYFLKKAVQLNHEFLADTHVVSTHKNTTEYQYLLLNKTNTNDYYLASNLNYLLTKKRLQMMTKQSSRSILLFKKIAVLPLLVGFVFLFAQRVVAQEKAPPEIVAEYNELAKKCNDQPDDNKRVRLRDVKKINALYGKLNEAQKKQAQPYPDFPPPPPAPKIINGQNPDGDFIPPPPPPPPFDDEEVQEIETIYEQPRSFNKKGNFLISVEKEANFLRLRCYDCRWANLKLDLNKTFIIDDFGFSNGKKMHEDIFAFKIKATNKSIILKSLKGTSWKRLDFKSSTGKEEFLNRNGKVKIETVNEQQSKTKSIKRLKSLRGGKQSISSETPSSLTSEKSIIKKPIQTQQDSVQKGWKVINNETYYYAKYPDGTIEYYNRWGNRVDENGKVLTEKDTIKNPKQQASLDSIPTKTGWEQVGENYYAYKVFNGKKYYYDKNSGKQVSVTHPEPEDYDAMMRRIKNSKKEFYIEGKRVTKKEFMQTTKGEIKYYRTGIYSNDYKIYKLHASKSKEFIEKLPRKSTKKGFAITNNKEKNTLEQAHKVITNGEISYYLDGKVISKNELNIIDHNSIKSIDVIKDEKGGGKIKIYSK